MRKDLASKIDMKINQFAKEMGLRPKDISILKSTASPLLCEKNEIVAENFIIKTMDTKNG